MCQREKKKRCTERKKRARARRSSVRYAEPQGSAPEEDALGRQHGRARRARLPPDVPGHLRHEGAAPAPGQARGSPRLRLLGRAHRRGVRLRLRGGEAAGRRAPGLGWLPGQVPCQVQRYLRGEEVRIPLACLLLPACVCGRCVDRAGGLQWFRPVLITAKELRGPGVKIVSMLNLTGV